ncbi:MAG: HAD hydrolase family protein, partial [Kineothrix sp.]|nr:HAD hydrolase family protein [Kineothrix sp.]
ANCLASGDEANDISMIQAAARGIAMKNAKENVKQAADIVTEADNNHDGLVSILLQNI